MRRIRFEVPGCPEHGTDPKLLDALEACPECSALYMAYEGLRDRFDEVKVEVVDGND